MVLYCFKILYICYGKVSVKRNKILPAENQKQSETIIEFVAKNEKLEKHNKTQHFEK